jgi:hypothetical protein
VVSLCLGPQGKASKQKAKAVIAIASEMISSNLDKMQPADRILALCELIRRLTKRMETEATKVIECTSQES